MAGVTAAEAGGMLDDVQITRVTPGAGDLPQNGGSRMPIATISPVTGETLQEFKELDQAEIDARIAAAREMFFFFRAEDGIRDGHVTGVQTCALPIFRLADGHPPLPGGSCGQGSGPGLRAR